MPTITVRVSVEEKADVEARAGQAGISALVRRALDLERDGPDLQARLDDHESRLARLERMAGIEGP